MTRESRNVELYNERSESMAHVVLPARLERHVMRKLMRRLQAHPERLQDAADPSEYINSLIAEIRRERWQKDARRLTSQTKDDEPGGPAKQEAGKD